MEILRLYFFFMKYLSVLLTKFSFRFFNIGKNFNTFSMGSDSSVHDESIQAMKYAKYLETSHYSTYMNAEYSLDALD